MTDTTASTASAAPLNVGNVHTQANNFIQAVQSGVDPRTGQFNLAITLPLGMANDLGGPSWSFTLAFSSLASHINSGFGHGWGVSYSELIRDQQWWSLRLSSGEQFVVDLANSDLNVGGRLAFQDYKLDAIRVTVLANNQFKVEHKSGEFEILRRVNDQGNAYVLHEVRSPEGRSLYFDWVRGNNINYLEQVRDENRVLASINRVGIPSLTLEPQTTHETVIRFEQQSNELRWLRLPTLDQPFVFLYKSITVGGGQTLRFPTKLTGPLGAEDTISWSETAQTSHRLPSAAPIDFLPRVILWTHSDGVLSNTRQQRYQWVGTNNYLGYGNPEGIRWERGWDTLYKLRRRYDYSVIETLSAGAVTLATIIRTWDRHHLPINETTKQGTCQTEVVTDYDINYDVAWESQQPWCQLPIKVTTTYTDTSDPETTRERSECIEYSYDIAGNILTTTFPSQVVEQSDYYDPAGEGESFSPDPSGMIRFLKKKTVTPATLADGTFGGAPVLTTDYTYENLPSSRTDDPPHAVVKTEQLHDTTDPEKPRLLEKTTNTYVLTPGPHYGRLDKAETELGGVTTTTDYSYDIVDFDDGEDGYGRMDKLLRTTTTVKGFEDDATHQSATCEGRSLITGLTREERSPSGALTVYKFDELGRIRKTTIAKGSDYQAVRTAQFHLSDDFSSANAPNFPGSDEKLVVGLDETDATGQHKYTWLDGSGRELMVQLQDIDNPVDGEFVFRDVANTQYDGLGRVTKQTSYDWKYDWQLDPEEGWKGVNAQAIEQSLETTYDDWGNADSETSLTGVTTRTVHDPITLCTEQWQEDSNGKPSSKQVTYSNLAGSPVEQVLHDDSGRKVRTVRFTRDGLDRVTQQRTIVAGKPDIVIGFLYDAYSRVLERTLPDGTKVIWTYAKHSDGEHPESVSVQQAEETP